MTGSASGLVQGGLGGPEDQLLEAGQEVFSRAEVERYEITCYGTLKRWTTLLGYADAKAQGRTQGKAA